MINLHIELSIITALHNVLNNETYYINGTITDAGIAILIHLCPLGCNGNGICVISIFSLFNIEFRYNFYFSSIIRSKLYKFQ